MNRQDLSHSKRGVMHKEIADKLAKLYELPYGGKQRGRFRISTKLFCSLAGRRRLYEDDIRIITRELLERGFILIDMGTYFSILTAATASTYRRVNAEAVEAVLSARTTSH